MASRGARVSTYRRIAAHLGVPKGARAVGNALATNPFPIVIPCHRAIRSDGALGGYQGGLAMKRALLMQEGVDVDERGRVVSPRLYLSDNTGVDRQRKSCYKQSHLEHVTMNRTILSKNSWWWRNFIGGVCLLP